MWWVVLACSSGPTITSVSPSEVLPGATVQILGEGFAEGLTVVVSQESTTHPLGDVIVRGAMVIEASLPEQMAPGSWIVRVDQDGSVARLEPGLTVMTVEEETPCGDRWRSTHSQVSRDREEVVVDRFGRDEERDIQRIDFSDVAGVEYELVRLSDDELCSVVYVRRTDGRRLAIDSDKKQNLATRAYRVGNALRKPTTVTRADLPIDDDPRPVEQH
ncbi:MAG: hypothetical protein KTR31_03900 [Myxococcales bacterium]|nr:hypothetical protein [Myxococcales bacterium]